MSYLLTRLCLFFLERVVLCVWASVSRLICVESVIFEGALLRVPVSLTLDWVRCLFVTTVVAITFRVMLYCWSYMSDELNH